MTDPNTVQLSEQGQTADPAFTPAQPSVDPAAPEAQPSADVTRIGEISTQVLTDIKAAQGPLQPTAIDAQGVERIVGPAVDDNWTPAPIEAHPDEIAHIKRVHEASLARRDDRLAATQVPAENLAGGHEVTKAALEAERTV